MNGHTPGPWKTRVGVHGHTSVFSGSVNVAHVPKPRNDNGGALTQALNAALVSTAPELLEALEDHLRWYEGKLLGPDGERELIERTRAALAKARGDK